MTADVRLTAQLVVGRKVHCVSDASVEALARRVLELEGAVADEAVAYEREQCAVVAWNLTWATGDVIAGQIRKRSEGGRPAEVSPVAHEHSPVLVEKPAVDGVFKVGDRVRHKYAPTSCVGVVIDARGLECRVRVDAMPNVSQPDERWIPNYNLEHVPVMHVDPAKPGSDRTVAVLVEQPPQAYFVKPDAPPVPLSEEAMRVVVLQYRKKVLEAFDAWGRTPSDTRTWHQVVMEVDLP